MKKRQVVMLIACLSIFTGLFGLSIGGLAVAQGTLSRLTTASAEGRSSSQPSLNGDGSKVVFRSDSDFLGEDIPDNQNEIWLADVETKVFTRLTTTPPTSEGRSSSEPSISGDGTKIVFKSDADFFGQDIPAFQNEIWLYDTVSMTLTRVTTAVGNNRNSEAPHISGDGQWVVFHSDARFSGASIPDNQNEIWLYEVETKDLTRLTTASANGRDSENPRINGDGTKVVFQSDSGFNGETVVEGQSEIWLYDITNDIYTRTTNSQGGDRRSKSPTFNADGSLVAFDSDADFLNRGIPDNQFEVWLYSAETMTLTRVTTASASTRNSVDPEMSADGTMLAFRSDSDFFDQNIIAGQNEIWVYDVISQTLTRTTTASPEERDSFVYSLDADGSTLALHSDANLAGGDDIPMSQFEIWLFDLQGDEGEPSEPEKDMVFLPLLLKN